MKIKWRRGMEITPDIFEAQDQYNETMADSARRLSTTGGYGLLPETEISVTMTVVDDSVSLQVHALEAVVRSGQLLKVAGDSFSRSLPHAKGNSCYVVVHRDGNVEQEVNGILYSKPRFAYDYCTLDEINKDCLPIAKLCMEQNAWRVQDLYIPPCFTLNSHPWMIQNLSSIKNAVRSIIESLENKHKVSSMENLHLLTLELDDFNGDESPQQLYLLIKKISWLLSRIRIPDIKSPELPPFRQYNNNDFLLCAKPLNDYLHSFLDIVTAELDVPKEEPKEEEYIVYDGIIP